MPRITFSESRTPNDGSGIVFEAGQTYDLPVDSCARWVKRGAAVYTDKEPAAKPQGDDTFLIGTGGVQIEDPSAIDIPEGWVDLEWSELRALAKKFDDTVRSKDDATAAIEAELNRRHPS